MIYQHFVWGHSMQRLKVAAIAAFAAIMTTTSASALTLAQGATPAETPPASYRADVYVDSRGCAYVRAGIGGRTSWVPRVTRDRKVVCGLAPSSARRTAAAPAPAPRPAPAPVVRAPAPTPAPVVRAPAPTVASPAPRRVAVAPAPVQPVLRPQRPAPVPRVASVPRAARVTGTSQVAPQVRGAAGQTQTVHVACVNPGDQMTVSGGGAKLLYTCTAREQVVQTVRLSNGTSLRIVATRSPHEYVRSGRYRAAQAAPAYGRAAPGTGPAPVSNHVVAGYRSAWEDDRLNPQRGPRTAAGNAQMARVWDDSVPMRPVATAARGSAATLSAMNSAPVRSTGRGGQYVQAASFANPANAQRTARRIANLGLPVRTLKVTRRGKALRLVQAGPFADSGALRRALGQVRGLGFSDAYATR